MIQSIVATNNGSTTATGSSLYNDTTVAVIITPTSFANAIRVRTFGGAVWLANTTSVVHLRLRNTTLGVTVGPDPQTEDWDNDLVNGNIRAAGPLFGVHKPLVATAQTYKVQITDEATGGAGIFGRYTADSVNATIVAEELMT